MQLEPANQNTPRPSPQIQEVWKTKVLNLKKSWEEFTGKRVVIQSLPFKAIIELTQNCNFKCTMCPQSWESKYSKYNPSLNMSFDLFRKLAEQIFPTLIAADLRGFGETTMLPYWPEVISYLEKYPYIDWYLVTNLSHPKAELWEKMISLGFELGFSCDGATKETFEAIRVGANFKQIRKNLKVIQSALKLYNRGLIYFISTIQKKNFHEMGQIVELAAEFSVSEVQFKMVQGEKWQFYDLDPLIMKNHSEDAINKGLEHGVRVTFNDWFFTKNVDKNKLAQVEALPSRSTPNNFQVSPAFDRDFWGKEGLHEIFTKIMDFSSRTSINQKCYKPFGFTYINYEGLMGTCNHMIDPGMLVMGDLRKESLKEIWNCEAYQDFRRQLITATPKDPRCQWCFKHRLED